jgi:hypothetical protein
MTDTTNPQADVVERVARHLASTDWLTTPEQWDRGSASFRADYLAHAREVIAIVQSAVPVPASAPTDGSVREQLLDALDFAYCVGIGYATPDALVAAYDATLLPPTDQTALRDRIAAAIDGVFDRWQTGLGDQRPQDAVRAAVLAVLPTPADRGAIIREAADAITADAALRDTEGEHDLAEYGRELTALIDPDAA